MLWQVPQYAHPSRYPKVFESMTGVRTAEFDALLDDILPRYAEAEVKRLRRPDCQRAIGGANGHAVALAARRRCTRRAGLCRHRFTPSTRFGRYACLAKPGHGVRDNTPKMLIVKVNYLMMFGYRSTFTRGVEMPPLRGGVEQVREFRCTKTSGLVVCGVGVAECLQPA